MTLVGVLSWFSRKTRAVLLLILPGLITRRSRHLIFAIVLGILTNGAVPRIMENFRRVLDNASCMYMSVVVVACAKKEEFRMIMLYAKSMYNTLMQFKQTFDKMSCEISHVDDPRRCTEQPYDPFPYRNNTLDVVKALSGPSTKLISEQAESVMSSATDIVSNVDVIRKVITVISLVVLLVDAVSYLRKYTTDSSFDNSFIGLDTWRYWKGKEERYKKKSEKCDVYPLTHWDISSGLRHWEINEGYRTSTLPELSKRTIFKFLRNCLSTLLFSLFVGLVLGIDALLAAVLQDVKDSPKFHIHVDGISSNEP